jgi:hypothetical protein
MNVMLPLLSLLPSSLRLSLSILASSATNKKKRELEKGFS